jgi:probable HAF family extracellular repeat protein
MLIDLRRHSFASSPRRLWLALAVPLLFSVSASAQEYTWTDLGALGGSTSLATSVNNAGQVVGTAAIAGNGHSDPFLYSDGTMTDVWTGGTKFGGTTVAINNIGHYVVNYTLNAQGATESFINVGTNWADLGIGGAVAMNNNDTVVGAGGEQGYWVYTNYELNTNPAYTLPGPYFDAGFSPYSINDAGLIIGMCAPTDPGNYSEGCVIGPSDAPYILGNQAQGSPTFAIRADGTSCGMDYEAEFAIWSNNGTQTYYYGPNLEAYCNGLNDSGVAVGAYYPTTPTSTFALVYDPVNGMRLLDGLVQKDSIKGRSVTIQNAIAISDTGFIAANCLFGQIERPSETRACLLTPNWAKIMRGSFIALAKSNPDCVQCKTELEREAESLPSSFTGLSAAEKNKAAVTVEGIRSRLVALWDGGRINEQVYQLLLHDTQMSLQALGRYSS